MNKDKGLFISCLKATAFIEKKKIVGLSFLEKCKLTLHTKMCKVCKAYIKESETIDQGLSKLAPTEDANNDALKSEIIDSLKKIK